MELILKAKIENVFKSKDYTDKKTGVVTDGKWKIQTFNNVEQEDGSNQIKLVDISIPEPQAQKYKDSVGEVIELKVSTYVHAGKVGFYGIE